jgi:hypothetical protein
MKEPKMALVVNSECQTFKRIVFQPRYSADPIQVRSLPEPPKKKIKHFIVNKGGDGNFYMTKGCSFRKLSLLIDYYQVG